MGKIRQRSLRISRKNEKESSVVPQNPGEENTMSGDKKMNGLKI